MGNRFFLIASVFFLCQWSFAGALGNQKFRAPASASARGSCLEFNGVPNPRFNVTVEGKSLTVDVVVFYKQALCINASATEGNAWGAFTAGDDRFEMNSLAVNVNDDEAAMERKACNAVAKLGLSQEKIKTVIAGAKAENVLLFVSDSNHSLLRRSVFCSMQPTLH